MNFVNPAVQEALRSGSPIKLAVGGGATPRAGYFNIDRAALPQVDIVADLNQPLTLLPDNCVSAVHASHVLEHVGNLLGLMEELHRVCRPDAALEIVVPHFSSSYYHSDPTHLHAWGIHTISYFMDPEDQAGRKVPSYYSTARFRLLERRLVFERLNLLDRILVPILRALMNRRLGAMEIYERRWAWIYPAQEIRLKLAPKK